MTVNGVETTISSFLLTITSVENEAISRTAIVNVLDKIDAELFGLFPDQE